MKAGEVNSAWQQAEWNYKHQISYLQEQLRMSQAQLNSTSNAYQTLHQSHEKLKKHVKRKQIAIVALGLLFIGIALLKGYSIA